ncbi:response regulator [Rhodobacterales bacterium HKCCE3408]|nr:response regulator [Rhodobacterales bacterium HKCCE3408]
MTDDRRLVLVVEDEPIIALDIADALSGAGWTVVGPVGTLETAERAVAARLPDAAILDVNLRGKTTVELARWLRDRDVPVILLTGGSRSSLPEALQDLTLLSKPATVADLLAQLPDAGT